MVQAAPASSNPGNNGIFYGVASQAAAGQTPSGSSTPTAGTGATSSTEAPPSAAQSAYEYQNYVAPVNLVLGPQMAEMLGLSATQTYSGDAILRQFEQLFPPGALIQLESLLYSAGFYASDIGEPLSSRVNLGGTSNDDFAALSAAVLKVGNSGLTLTQVINNQIASGAGYLAQQGALQPQTGGGNVYQIKKTSPDDIYATAMSTFQQYLGRNPTQQEINAMVAGYNQLETNYQTTLNTQTENESQAQYASKLAQRQAQMTPAVPPSNGSGNIPNGPFTTPSQYAVAILEYMGAQSITAQNVGLLVSWINANGGLHGKGQFNPLGVGATSQGSTGSGGATNYTSWAQGVMNAVDLLTSPQYGDLRATLMSGSTSTLTAAASSELSQWSNGAVTSLKPTKTVLNQAAQAVKAYVPQQTPAAANPALSSPPPTYIGTWNPGGSPLPTPLQSPSQLPPQMTAQGQTPNEGNAGGEPAIYKPGMISRPQQAAPAATPGTPYSSTFTPVTTVGQGQGMTSPGDTYLPSSTATLNQPPSLSGYATTEATTGANQLPYMTNQYLQAYQSILGMIKAEF